MGEGTVVEENSHNKWWRKNFQSASKPWNRAIGAQKMNAGGVTSPRQDDAHAAGACRFTMVSSVNAGSLFIRQEIFDDTWG